ncbi:uveal autoantigen with coiled-coil domains and ankyrin repeats-like [Fundulus heteroclitus]|uniref:uveal autoantigen with coiled-coil domains and ankyrin repeats-like n=1 Tax=Fundulus heteroclitus TaxID=8078 RepID=UPI00165B9FDB|nr:uveal autoantigen with coiled-coil domains and ankyrin repeats-like [Fundulus heteroclitus]
MSTRSKAEITRKVTFGLLQSETAVEENTRAVVMMSEVEFHAALGSKDQKISALQQENAALSENLKSLASELHKMEVVHQHANKKARQLESELTTERKKVQEAEISFRQLAPGVKAAPVHQHEDEKTALRDEVLRLTQIVEKQQTEHEDDVAVLYDERIKTNKDRRDAIRRADQLKVSLMAEKNKTREIEICSAKQMEEISKLQAALVKVERNLEEERKQWEQEKLRLLTNNQETSEVEQLKYQLQEQTVKHEDQVAALYNELIRKNKESQDAIKRAEQLKEDLTEEKNRAKEAEDCLAQQKEETSNLQAALVLMERTLEDQRRQWEQEKSHLLTKEQERDELEQLVKHLESQKAEAEQEIAALRLEQQKNNQSHQDAARKVVQLEIALVAEKSRTKEAENCLAEQVKESCEIEAALVKMEQDVENQRRLWAQEKSSLLTEQQKAVRNVEAARKDVLEVLHDERQEWQTEKSCLLEMVATTEELLKEAEVKRKASTLNLIEKLKNLQQEMDKLQESKPKKKSLRKRIAQIFKRSKKAPSQSEN